LGSGKPGGDGEEQNQEEQNKHDEICQEWRRLFIEEDAGVFEV